MTALPAGVSLLENIPLHLFEYIYDHLAADDVRNRSLFALSSTSRWFCSATARSRFQTIRFRFKNLHSLKCDVALWRGISQARDCARYVRRLDITGYMAHEGVDEDVWPQDSDLGFWRNHQPVNYYSHGRPLTDEDTARQTEEWHPLIDLVPSLTGLKDVSFAGHEPIAAALLSALQNHPQGVQLHIHSFALRSLDHPASRLQDIDAFDKALASSPCLSSIRVQDARWAYEAFESNVKSNDDAVWRMVAGSAPRLKSVLVDFRKMGARSDFSPDVPPGDTVRNKAALDALCLRGQGILNTPFILGWSRTVDFNSLRSLQLDVSIMAPTVIETLCEIAEADHGFQSLRDLSLTMSLMIVSDTSDEIRVDTDLARLFSALQPLDSLEIRGILGDEAFRAVLRSHGQSLRELRLIPLRRMGILLDPFVLTLNRVRALTRMCPNIRDLELLIQRSKGDEEEVQTYRALGEFRRLDRLSVQLDSSILNPVPGVEEDTDDATIDAMTDSLLRDVFINAALDADLAADIFECICRRRSPRLIRLVTAEVVIIGNDWVEWESRYSDTMPIMDYLSRGWVRERDTRYGHEEEFSIAELDSTTYARALEDRWEEGFAEPFDDILRSIWPSSWGTKEGREWSSFPLWKEGQDPSQDGGDG